MEYAIKRKFHVGEIVYVIDCWDNKNGMQAFGAHAKIMEVNEENHSFVAILYGNTRQRYNFYDYGRLIFDTEYEVINAVEQLPIPTSKIYHVIGKRVFQRTVIAVQDKIVNGYTDMVLKFDKGKDISISQIEKTVFLSENAAKMSIQK